MSDAVLSGVKRNAGVFHAAGGSAPVAGCQNARLAPIHNPRGGVMADADQHGELDSEAGACLDDLLQRAAAQGLDEITPSQLMSAAVVFYWRCVSGRARIEPASTAEPDHSVTH